MELAGNTIRVRGALIAGLIAHAPHFALLAGLCVAALVMLGDDDERLSMKLGLLLGYWAVLLPFFLAVAALFGLLRLRGLQRRGRPLDWAPRWLARRPWPEILLLRVPLALGLAVATSYLYFTFKVNIPTFAEFSWDHFFAGIDRLLFFGTDPWAVTHALLPWVWATKLFDAAYLAWYFVLVAAIVGAGALPLRHPLRLTFLLAIGLDWVIGGVILATLLPAAGPIYLERVAGDPAFRPLLELLHSQAQHTRIMALEIQEWLWAGYALAEVEPAGISAFPSLHVAIPATCACLGFAADRAVGWMLTLFTLAVLVGSVHLGWHYAIDGFGGIALGLACWWASRRIVAWWLRLTEPRMPRATKRPFATR